MSASALAAATPPPTHVDAAVSPTPLIVVNSAECAEIAKAAGYSAFTAAALNTMLDVRTLGVDNECPHLAPFAGRQVTILSVPATIEALNALAHRLSQLVGFTDIRLLMLPPLPVASPARRHHLGAEGIAPTFLHWGDSIHTELARLIAATLPWRPTPVQEAAALSKGFILPHGFRLTLQGIEKEKVNAKGVSTWTLVCRTPMWLVSIATTATGSSTLVGVMVRDNGRMRGPIYLDVGAVNTARLLAEWAAEQGVVGLTGEAAGIVLDYLIAAYRTNASTLPITKIAVALGFERNSNGEAVAFIHGGMRHVPGEEPTPVDISPAVSVPRRQYRAYKTSGTPEGWARAFAMVRGRELMTPVTMLGLGLGSLLNDGLGLMPVVAAMAGDGGGGKTTTLKFVGSAMARPADSYRSARVTANAMEGLLRFAGDLPLLIDESSSTGGGKDLDRDLPQVIYMVSERTGKARMTKGLALRESAEWACNMVSTGEIDVGEASANSGVRRRVITLVGSPMGPRVEETRQFVDQLEEILDLHFGHVAPVVALRFLALDDAGIGALKQHHRQLATQWVKRARNVDTGLVALAAQHFASAQIVLEWIVERFPAPMDLGGEATMPTIIDLLTRAWDASTSKLRSASRPERVLEAVRHYFAAHKAEFDGCPPELALNRPTFCVPRGKIAVVRGVPAVAFEQRALEQALERAGFSWKVDVDHLKESGTLMLEEGKMVKVRFNGSTLRLPTIPLSLLEGRFVDDVTGEEDELPTPIPI